MESNNHLAPAKASVASIVLSAFNYRVVRNAIHQFIVSKPSVYYEDVGFDVIEGGNNESYHQSEAQLWQNCGYWDGESNYRQACQNLARRIGVLAELDSSESTLDVGFGFGEQDIFWASNFDVKKITGINITPFQVEFAKNRAKEFELDNVVSYQVGDAVNLNIPDNSVDRVICLQSAFQFNTRDDFFAEAYRVLKPGGIFVAADMIMSDDCKKSLNPWAWFTRRRVGWSHKNVYSSSTYKNLLEVKGFQEVDISSIRNNVFPGMREYIKRRYNGEEPDSIIIDTFSSEGANKASDLWKFHYGVDDYVLVKAIKR